MANPLKSGSARLLVFLERSQHVELKELSKSTGAPMNWHIREAIAAYLERHGKRKGK